MYSKWIFQTVIGCRFGRTLNGGGEIAVDEINSGHHLPARSVSFYRDNLIMPA
jgi:hypothetical protein